MNEKFCETCKEELTNSAFILQMRKRGFKEVF